ncbi:MAG: Flagellar biosynthesis protein FliQ, partial [uncultured Quadrisphaera sp.]
EPERLPRLRRPRDRPADHARRRQAQRPGAGDRARHRLRDLPVPVGHPDPGGHPQLRAQGPRRGRGPAGVRALDAADPRRLHQRPLRAAAGPALGGL